MSSFMIDMGQGVVAPADVSVFTVPLYSCTLVAGHDAGRHYGGAFHYPANSLASVSTGMTQWVNTLNPAAIRLVYASTVSQGMGTPAADRAALESWFRRNHPRIPLTTTSATSACMTLENGAFYAGTTADHASWDDTPGTDLIPISAGRTPEYVLIDTRSQPTAAAVASAARQGRFGFRAYMRRKLRKYLR